MEKYKERLLSVLSIALIFVVIIGIVIGLYFLGIFKFPAFIEVILFGNEQTNANDIDNSNSVYGSISETENSISNLVLEITSENLKELLSDIKPMSDYYHEVTTNLYSGTNTLFQKITMRRQDGFYHAIIYNSDGLIEKEIQQFENTVDITYYDQEGSFTANKIPSAKFDISDQTGVLVTHEYFLESLSLVYNASYDFSFDSFGTVVRLSFETTLDDYVQKQIYWLSLDYGVVVKAQSYENNNLIYQMNTVSLTDI